MLKYCNLLFASKWTPVSQLVLEAYCWFVGSYHPGCYSRPLLTTKTHLLADEHDCQMIQMGTTILAILCNFEFNKNTWCCSGYQISTQTWDSTWCSMGIKAGKMQTQSAKHGDVSHETWDSSRVYRTYQQQKTSWTTSSIKSVIVKKKNIKELCANAWLGSTIWN